MVKVELPRSVAGDIERLREAGWTDRELLTTTEFVICLTGEWEAIRKGMEAGAEIAAWLVEDMNRLPKYASAIINGYEIERTPAEKVREYYEKSILEAYGDDYDSICCGHAKMRAIEFFADVFGIKIEGVNL